MSDAVYECLVREQAYVVVEAGKAKDLSLLRYIQERSDYALDEWKKREQHCQYHRWQKQKVCFRVLFLHGRYFSRKSIDMK